jgi:prepilin-type N-terminal cleavage/methylation domain-containing protein
MRRAFTLIELLVVLTIVTLVMGVVVPKGAKMLSGYERALAHSQERRALSRARAEAFLEAKTVDISVLGTRYHITDKGVMLETGDDHR